MTERLIKLVSFDLDNTLWDVEPVLLRAEAAQNHWLEQNFPRVFEKFDGDGLRDFRFRAHQSHPELAHQISKIRVQAMYEVLQHCGYSQSQSRQGAQGAFDAFLTVRHQVEPYEQALEVLERLAQHYTLGALSNGNADIFKTDIGEYFDFAYSAEQVDASKPLPDMFHAAMEETGAAGHEIVHVGDNPEHDVLGAQQVGMFTVWMNSGDWRWPAQRAPADEDIRQIEELPAAIARIESRAALNPQS
jgi:HAD superfamily hydrolase (TIGR01549 family)